MSSLLEHLGEGKMGIVVLVSILASTQVFGIYHIRVKSFLTLYLIETPFNAFANRADPDQAALVRAA